MTSRWMESEHHPMNAHQTSSPRILAGIDIGTLTCRLLIAELAPSGTLREVRSDRRILRLGQGVDRDRMLRGDAMARVAETLKEWCTLMEGYQVDASIAVATSAVRDAGNREEFVRLIHRQTGLEIQILSGEEEARRTILGIRSGLPAGVSDVLALDIGGGSTEFILDRPGQTPMMRSVDIGVVRLCERLLRHDPPTSEEIHQAREWVRAETVAAVGEMTLPVGLTFVGTAGTITSLAAMAQQLPTYEPARIHNYRLARTVVEELESTLLARTKSERVGLPGLEANREEVIAAGAIILRTVMETVRIPSLLVSDLGLREGVLLDLATRLDEDHT
ncbi:MAG: Ppx/GppA family phosphatase [Nitrospira sp.]|nr:Ppx/GppA family phosphatase [Nitrospira sp.]MCC7473194.1 Ppx/GppA family phosphatase [Candidatus Nomurabacteria bacterium]